MIVLALDPSTKSTGYAVYNDQNLIAHGCISAGSSNLFKRISRMTVETKFYVASAWRAKCGIRTGRGIKRESLKPQDIKFVQNQFGIKVNDDEADAICIGFAEVGGTIKQPQIIIDDGFEFA